MPATQDVAPKCSHRLALACGVNKKKNMTVLRLRSLVLRLFYFLISKV